MVARGYRRVAGPDGLADGHEDQHGVVQVLVRRVGVGDIRVHRVWLVLVVLVCLLPVLLVG